MVRSPASNKKGGRECRQQKREGRTRRNRWGHQQHPPLQTVSGAVGALYELPKKRGVPPPLSSTHCPFTEEAIAGLRGVHLLIVAVTTKRLLESATQEKAEVPPSACVRRIDPLTEG